MAGIAANFRTHGVRGLLALVLLFALLGPLAGGLPALFFQQVAWWGEPDSLPMLLTVLTLVYAYGLLPAVVTAVVVTLISPRGHGGSFARVWVAAMAATAITLPIHFLLFRAMWGTGDPGALGLIAMMVVACVLFTVPAASWCWWAASRLRLL
ncbi:hypothetical protein GCM10007301_34740 [Azorhizobium oxalatiphilum]|uniref:Transmembrane protein n=1 Tax=Azorhizobium oxalatiphilum TaxID=980631 RepID=A0A917C684_9HYPH|nr:hypothetical protein [Azorhizobium oxalatiphilum]GGF72015.1 hypothetical protein GCM10007301_34740 [Azorhizobium oxalatiphilum]